MIPKPEKKYISREKCERMLIGTLPFEDQETFFSSLSQRTAMILAGGEGCGKRTLEKQFFSQYSELFPKVLYFDPEEYADEGEEKLRSEIRSFFDKLKNGSPEKKEEPAEENAGSAEILSSSEPDEEEAEAYLISLGNISVLSGMPGAARVLAKSLSELLDDEDCMCIVIAVFDGEVRSIPACLRKITRICRVDPPSREERIQFFSAMMEPVAGYVNDTAGVDFMADNTEGLSFSELEETEKNLHIYLKAKFIADVAETSSVELTEVEMTDIGIDKVVLDQEDFLYIADSYREKAQPAGTIDMSGVGELIEKLGTASVKEKKEPPPSPFALIDDDDDPDFI